MYKATTKLRLLIFRNKTALKEELYVQRNVHRDIFLQYRPTRSGLSILTSLADSQHN